MFSRRFRHASGLSVLGLAALFALSLWGGVPTPGRANVLLITIDTLRADHLGCYGYSRIRTPSIDALAADGARFVNAYSPVPITLPAHTVIFTGSYPMRTGMHDFSGNRLNPRQPTMASLLHARGYATAGVIGSAVLDARFGLNHGFEQYLGSFNFNRLSEANLDEMERPGNEVVDDGLAWLKRNHQKPFFLWVHLYDPHAPYQPPPPYREEYRSHPYDGEIAFDDAQVGHLVSYLKKMRLYDRTLIVLVADHGESLGEHGENTHGFFIYNATLRVPLILKLPAGHPVAAKTVTAAVSQVDILPTVLQVVGVPTPSEVQGRSLLPLLSGQVPKAPEEIYSETYLPRLHFNWSELRGIEIGHYKFIEAPRPELYDLASDPGELRNVYLERRAVANAMRDRLAELIRRDSATSPDQSAEKAGLDPVLAERLKSLGYVAVSSGANGILSDRNSPDPKDRIQMYELVSDAIADSQHGRYAESVAKLKQTFRFEKDSIPVLYLLALDDYRQKDYPRAVEEFQRVLALSPGYSLAQFYLGLAYGEAGDWARAIAALQRALELDPTNFSAAFNLGSAYLKVGKVEESVAAFRKSVEIDPQYAHGYAALGEVLLYQGKTDEAIEALRKAVALEPGNAKARRTLARALDAKGLHEEAQKELKKAAKTPPR